MLNNVCPQCKRPDVLNWIHDQATDRFICAVCSDKNFHEGRPKCWTVQVLSGREWKDRAVVLSKLMAEDWLVKNRVQGAVYRAVSPAGRSYEYGRIS